MEASFTSFRSRDTTCFDGGSSQNVVEFLRGAIFSGEYAPNSFLPSQRKLAEEFGVGNWTIRMALDQLSGSGLVEAVRGRGTRVLASNDNRTEQKTVTFVHWPEMWRGSNGVESYRIRDGVVRRLRQLGYLCRGLAFYDEKTVKYRDSTDAHFVNLDELNAAADDGGAFIMLEVFEQLVEFAINLEKRQIPVVVANLEIDLDISGTSVDHVGVSVCAVETLAAFGHRRIAYLGVDPAYFFYGRALEGYRSGMQMVGLSVDESLVVFCERSTSLTAYQACKPLIERSDPPTAIVAGRDSIAAAACHAIEEAGLEVGRDISVIGFDDVTWDGDNDMLTTFHEPCAKLGTVAVDMLHKRIQNGWSPPEQRMIDAPLVLRRSVGPVMIKRKRLNTQRK